MSFKRLVLSDQQSRSQTYSVHSDIKQRKTHIRSAGNWIFSINDLKIVDYKNCWVILTLPTLGLNRQPLNWLLSACLVKDDFTTWALLQHNNAQFSSSHLLPHSSLFSTSFHLPQLHLRIYVTPENTDHMCLLRVSDTSMAGMKQAFLCCVQVFSVTGERPVIRPSDQHSLACLHRPSRAEPGYRATLSAHTGGKTNDTAFPKPSHRITTQKPSWRSHLHSNLWLCAGPAHLWAHLRNQEVKLNSSEGRI